MRTIALEEHFTTPEVLAAVARAGYPSAPAGTGPVQGKLADLGAGRLADMDAAGIDMQVLSLLGFWTDRLDAATAVAVMRDANDRVTDAVRAHPSRFAAFAALPMIDPNAAARELERAVTKLQCPGALISGTANGLFLDHPSFAPILEAAQALDVPIYVHPAPPPPAVQDAYFSGLPEPYGMLLSTAGWGWHTETGLHALRMIVAGVFDRYPRLQIIIGHMGEDIPYSLARTDGVLSRTPGRLSRTVAEFFHDHVHVTTSGYFTVPPFLCALSVVGADRLMFSVDYPVGDNGAGRAFLDALPVAPADREKVAHTNAERLLRLST
jgi:predicted TIM-barrel fold metal-dependent hydrolase